VAAYRAQFRPSEQLDRPYVIAGVNVVAAPTDADASAQFLTARRNRVGWLFGRGRTLSTEEADALLASAAGQHVQQMTRYSAIGTPDVVKDYLEAFAKHADADELIVAHQSPTTEDRLRSVQLVADVLLDD
jgi:alkanesulfonate monooxygenase SsuD/methylene tetrahydromethanopterin reductase-like flavin-dependent oxidoreductase (luciferase family)